jgi:hypothetical protein
MSKNIKGRKWMDTIYAGDIFDDALAITPISSGSGIDHVATHINRDKVLISMVRQYGEVLVNGLAEPRDVGRYLQEISKEAEEIEKEVKFGYQR